MRFPDFFLLGAAKAGTSALQYYINQHPDVCMAHPKEPFFFFTPEFLKGPEYYKKTYFRHYNGEKISGEAAHRSLFFPYVPERIKQFNPNPKLLVILRNPIDRAISHYNFHVARGEEDRDFWSAIEDNLKRLENGPFFLTPEEGELYTRHKWNADKYYPTYLDTGHYAEHIERYMGAFGKESIRIYFAEELRENPFPILNEVFDFLELSPFTPSAEKEVNALAKPYVYSLYKAVGQIPFVSRISGRLRDFIKRSLAQSFKKSKEPTDPKIVTYLRDYYISHNERLSKLLNKDLSHWDNI